jgi:large subunit ribosomal protein L9e
MRDVHSTEELDIPEGVDVVVKSRIITVTGPRGTLVKNVRHIDMDIRLVKTKSTAKVTLAVWQGGRKHVACLRTIRSLISNMIKGVTKVRFEGNSQLIRSGCRGFRASNTK